MSGALRRIKAALLFAVIAASCSDAPVTLFVDVQTDLVPGVEFASVQVQLGDRTASLGAAIGDDFRAARRVAEIADVPLGPTTLAVLLVDSSGSIVLRRDLEIDVRGSVGLTVVMTRKCLGVTCSDAGPGTVATTCVDGRCLPRACSSLERAACGTPECGVTRDCAVRIECAVPDCIDGICLAFGNDAMCGPGQFCHPDEGCRDLGVDLDSDGDGVVDDVDCDPADSSVGFRAERTCAGECATGLERCISGEWLPCDAPADCSCEIGETRTISCERCGQITQTCATGRWEGATCDGGGECSPGAFEDVGACGRCGTDRRTCLDDCTWDMPTCTGEGACAAGATENESESCGTCGETRTRTRTCNAACTWDAWSAFSACGTGMGCVPGTMETDTQSCGACGMQTRTRTCQSTCVFGAWTGFGACTGEGVCTPSTPGTESQPCGSCGAGTQLRSRTCTSSCVWGPWSPYSGCSTPVGSTVATGHSHGCLITSDGWLRCWGNNTRGQLGIGSFAVQTMPRRVGTETTWAAVTTAGDFDDVLMEASGHTCAIRSGDLYCWGEAESGQLGTGNRTDRNTPVRIGTATGYTDVDASYQHTCAVRAGELWCWGEGDFGRLGTGSATDRLSPFRVGTATNWTRVAAGRTHTCALQADGSLWCFGTGSSGQLGLGTTTNENTPQRVGTASWISVDTGRIYSCGIQTGGALYCWGNGGEGKLGVGDSMDRLTPTRVGTASDWVAVSTGYEHACGIRGTGTLYCWGDGGDGQLGVLPVGDRNTPTQVGTETDWAKISGGTAFTCGLRDGGLHCWGFDGGSRLGNGSVGDLTTPGESCF